MKISLLIFMSFAVQPLLYAQDSSRIKKSISLSQGFTHMIHKDLYRSPYIYQGINPSVYFSFEKCSPESLHRFNSKFTFGSMKTSFSPLARTSALNIDYSYLRKIISAKRYILYLGPQLNALGWKADYFPEMKVPAYSRVHSYMIGFSLGLSANLNYTINSRSVLKLFFSAPLCTYAERPKFLDGSPRQNQFGFLNFWNPQLQLVYEYQVSEKIYIVMNYNYGYSLYSKPKAVRILSNGISLGLKWRFR